MAEPSELEQMQRLSEGYRADLPGPLVGHKLPILDLVTEYSQADHTFVLKTQALAATHSGYRQIKGDGQCGWRGAVFGYFEMLLTLGDEQLLVQEETRIQSFSELMRMAGIDYDIIVDMFDYTWELFSTIKVAIEAGDKTDDVLMEPMNDEIKSNSIVYHFKMMTSAYMQLYPGNYEPFLDMPVENYRVSRIDPSNQEIDQIGLQVMTDAVIAPAGFALDVLYLDRSIGNEVTPHQFAPKNAGGPTISMLYRPGHYDLIYKDTRSIQVYYQPESLVRLNMQMGQPSTLMSDYQAYVFPSSTSSLALPSLRDPPSTNNQTSFGPGDSFEPSMDSTYLPLSQCHPPMVYPHLLSSSTPTYPVSTSPSCQSALSSPTSTNTPLDLRLMPSSQHSSPIALQSASESDDGPRIRPTKYVMEYRRVGESVPLCNTGSGAAASLSPAHFRNEGFQPQMWKAEDEYLR